MTREQHKALLDARRRASASISASQMCLRDAHKALSEIDALVAEMWRQSPEREVPDADYPLPEEIE